MGLRYRGYSSQRSCFKNSIYFSFVRYLLIFVSFGKVGLRRGLKQCENV
jgi:hypothetical protein